MRVIIIILNNFYEFTFKIMWAQQKTLQIRHTMGMADFYGTYGM